jgi:hypothetical protein
MVLYKYMKKEFADLFFLTGSLRIGTLFDFRKTEKHNKAISDKREGTHQPFVSFGNLPLKAEEMPTDLKGFLDGVIHMEPGSSISNGIISKLIQSPDHYVFCLSTKYDKKIMESFECNTCVEIDAPDLFFYQITKKIRHLAGPLAWSGPVSYTNKEYDFREEKGFHPATTKDVEYDYQCEYRAVWEPIIKNKDTFLEPLFIKIPKARRLCRIIK